MRASSPNVGFGPTFAAAGSHSYRPPSPAPRRRRSPGSTRRHAVEVRRREADRAAALRPGRRPCPRSGTAGRAAPPPAPHPRRPAAARTRLLDTGSPPTTQRRHLLERRPRPRRRARAACSCRPARPRPKRKSYPSTTAFAPSCRTSTSSKNASGLSASRPGVGPQDDDVVGPGGVEQLGPVGERGERRPRRAGRGAAARRGGGSNVTATAGPPTRSARRRAAATSAWCPRWTPSKLPTVTAPPRSSGGGCSVQSSETVGHARYLAADSRAGIGQNLRPTGDVSELRSAVASPDRVGGATMTTRSVGRPDGRRRGNPRGGKSGLHRARWWVTPTPGNGSGLPARSAKRAGQCNRK